MSASLFPGIAGHARILAVLARAIREDRLAHALLFLGPGGVGKLTAAVALARCLLCERGAPGACPPCGACRRIDASSLLHPDVGFLHPQPSGKAGEEGDREAAENPVPPDLHALQEEARENLAWRIPVETARSRFAQLSLSPALGPRRILLVLEAERLGDAAGNALLKVLEEPPGRSVLVLLTGSAAALLPTLRSRCQICRFNQLSREEVAGYLQGRHAVEPGPARLAAALSGGRIGAALALTRELDAYRTRRDLLGRILSEIRRDGTAAGALAGAASLLAQEGELASDLAILMDLLRDAMVRASGCAAEKLLDPEPGAIPEALRVPAREGARMLLRVERARDDLRRRVNRQLAVETMFLDLVSGSEEPAPAAF